MNKKSILAISIASIACTSTSVCADEIKTIKKDNIEYIQIEETIKKAGGTVTDNSKDIEVNIGNKNLIISKENSFAKIQENYYPLHTTEVDGFIVPKDTKIINEKEKAYIEKDFFKNNKILELKPTIKVEKPKAPVQNIVQEETPTIKPETTPSKPKPTTPKPNPTPTPPKPTVPKPPKPPKPNPIPTPPPTPDPIPPEPTPDPIPPEPPTPETNPGDGNLGEETT